VNEPVANACRTCGRWPSLFELEGSTLEVDGRAVEEDELPAETVDVEQFEPETFEPAEPTDAKELPPEFEPEAEEPSENKRRRVLPRLILPVGIAVYLLIRTLVDS
jgi:hypothetical protein